MGTCNYQRVDHVWVKILDFKHYITMITTVIILTWLVYQRAQGKCRMEVNLLLLQTINTTCTTSSTSTGLHDLMDGFWKNLKSTLELDLIIPLITLEIIVVFPWLRSLVDLKKIFFKNRPLDLWCCRGRQWQGLALTLQSDSHVRLVNIFSGSCSGSPGCPGW